jgi:hypothetical protein
MSPSRNCRRPQQAGIALVPALSLLLGLCLQAGADVPATPNAQASKPAARQSVAPASDPAATQAQPARKVARRSSLAASAATTPLRKPRSTGQRRKNPGREILETTPTRQQLANLVAARQQRVGELLARAQLDYLEGRLFEPTGNNAAVRYKEVLELDPVQPEALARVQRIVDVIAAEGEHVALAGDAPRTLQYILLLRDLQPKNVALPGLEARYQAVLANPVVFSARQQDRYVRSAQTIDEAYDKLKNQPAGLQTIEQVVRRYDRAETFVRQAPGLPQLKDRIIVAFPAAVRAELADAEPRRALNIVLLARERGWFTPELEPLEAQAKRDIKAKWLIPGLPPRQPQP